MRVTGTWRRTYAAAAAGAVTALSLAAAPVAYSAPTDPTPGPPSPTGSPEPAPTPSPTPEKPKPKPKKKPDTKAPPAPQVGTPEAGAEGRITVTVTTERGARVVIREQGAVVAEGRADGGSVTLTWTTTTGSHSYVARASDKRGNTSEPTTFTAEADADPPRLTKVGWTAGTPQDSRSSVRFRTDINAVYRVLVDGIVVADGTAEERVVERVVDVPDGDHDAVVEVLDEVGNTTTRERDFRVRIRSLDVAVSLTSEPTTRTQVLRVEATPNATGGVVRVPGMKPREFSLDKGSATVRLTLRENTYDGVTVSVRDTQSRRGVSTVPRFEVDTTPPLLSVSTDSRAGAGGRLVATIRTEPGTEVRWTLQNADGVAADSGTFTADERETTVSRDVDAGSYELEVVATDAYDRTVTRSSDLRVATDPRPVWLIVLTGLAVAIGGIALVFLVVWLLRLVARAIGPRLSSRRDHRRLVAADAARRARSAEQEAAGAARTGRAAVVGDFLYGVTEGWEVGDLPGLDLRPGETVRHMTVATAYESEGDGPAFDVRTLEGALVVTGQRLVLLGDDHREWPVQDVGELVHVGADESVIHHAGDDERWTVLSYGEAETTRLHLDHLRAEQEGRGPENLEARRAELAAGREDKVDLSAWV